MNDESEREMTANELADELAFKHIAGDDNGAFSSKIITMLRQQQTEIEALKKQIPDWKNINKPNPFIGLSENSNYKPLPSNSGLGGSALKKASEK